VALDTGTFAPGSLTDNTGAGNTCDTQNDPVGCIFTEDLLVLDATEDEIAAAVTGVSACSGAVSTSSAVAPPPAASSTAAVLTADCTALTTTVTMMMTETSGAAIASSTATVAASGTIHFPRLLVIASRLANKYRHKHSDLHRNPWWSSTPGR
jgi:hypothetical protein